LDKIWPMKNINKCCTFGERLRTLRQKSGLTLKEVAKSIEIDTSLLAKIERDERIPTKLLIITIADYFKVDAKELINEFMSDQIAYKILDEESDIDILKVAEKKFKYRITKH